MRILKFLTALGLVCSFLAPIPAMAQAQTLVIGVDHADPANQRPDLFRLFEYTDLFSRSVTVHTGDTIDLRSAPGSFHVIGFASDEAKARAVYPVGSLDNDDPVKAKGSGLPKVELGPSNFSIIGGSLSGGGKIGQNPNGPPDCGVTAMGQKPCTFSGGNDVEVPGPEAAVDQQGNPAPLDVNIVINAPPGTYKFFCFIHPGMSATLTVVGSGQTASTQAQIDAASATQFAADQAAALAAEKAANQVKFSGGAPGTRTYQVSVGVTSSDLHATVLEMLPQHLDLVAGDKVNYVWASPNEVHTVGFPSEEGGLNGPFGFDCGSTFQNPPEGPPAAGAAPFVPCVEAGKPAPELVGDPGTSPSGTALTDPAAVVDAGLLVGTGYGIQTSAPQWSIVTNGATKSGTYTYMCTVHDWMHGTLAVAGAASAPTTTTGVSQTPASPAQIPAKMPSTGAGGESLAWAGLMLAGLILIGLGGLRLVRRKA